jgi:hypothetical protein
MPAIHKIPARVNNLNENGGGNSQTVFKVVFYHRFILYLYHNNTHIKHINKLFLKLFFKIILLKLYKTKIILFAFIWGINVDLYAQRNDKPRLL